MLVSVRVRRYSPPDYEGVLWIENVSFGRRDAHLYISYYATQDYFLVAELDGEVVGYAVGSVLDTVGKVVSIAVHPMYRRCGIGKSLLKTLLDNLFKSGVGVIRLEVRESNIPAYSLYERLGFRQTGFVPSYYPDGEGARIYELRRETNESTRLV